MSTDAALPHLPLLNNSGPGTASYDVIDDVTITWDSSARCHVIPYVFHVMVGVFVAAVGLCGVLGNLAVLCTFAR